MENLGVWAHLAVSWWPWYNWVLLIGLIALIVIAKIMRGKGQD